jgi:hypothetical protein
MAILKVHWLKRKYIMGFRRKLPKEADVRKSLAQWLAPTVNCCDVATVTIDILPDVALLEIFDFYMFKLRTGAWYKLVHVCRKWRNLVFGSPRRLGLQLHCGVHTPVRETLDVWPPLPISISVYGPPNWVEDNIIAALGHNHRISELLLGLIPSWHLQNVLAAMQKPFPALTRLELVLHHGDDEAESSVFPASFLGGSAPQLQTLDLQFIPFPGLPTLLLSTTHLVHLSLTSISHSEYFSPEAMITCLSVLTRLKTLDIRFRSADNCPDRKSRRPDLQTRILLPVLAELGFSGASKYLDDLVAGIDAPLLDKLRIIFFHERILDTPELSRFIGRAPKFNTLDEASVVFYRSQVMISFSPPFNGDLSIIIITCSESDLQLSSLTQVCRSSFPRALILAVEHLYIFEHEITRPRWQNDIESRQWLELLHPFTTVKDLYISREFAPRIAPTLQELAGERVTEALPALQSLFLEETLQSESVQEGIRQFVDARQLTSHPVNVSRWRGRRTNWLEL